MALHGRMLQQYPAEPGWQTRTRQWGKAGQGGTRKGKAEYGSESQGFEGKEREQRALLCNSLARRRPVAGLERTYGPSKVTLSTDNIYCK